MDKRLPANKIEGLKNDIYNLNPTVKVYKAFVDFIDSLEDIPPKTEEKKDE